MELYLKAIILEIKKLEKANSNGQMVMSLLDNSDKIKKMVKE